MHERSRTTPRRRGPKHPLPNNRHNAQNIGAQEPPYYTIDNTEDIYGTNILPSQRCYIDPWDLENYDYVRSKLIDPPTPNEYYESPNPEEDAMLAVHDNYLYGTRTQQEPEFEEYAPRMAATMPRRTTRRSSQYQCELNCCSAQAPKQRYNTYRKASVPVTNKYEDYMTYRTRQFQADIDDDNHDDPAADYLEQQQLYNGYGANSSNSSNERHSSIGEDVHYAAYQPYVTPITTSGTLKRITKSPHIDFPEPPKQPPPPTRTSPAYDYCQPYAATLPPTYCSIPDCYECISNSRVQNPHELSLIYAAPSTYNSMVSPISMSVYDTGDLYSGATSTLARQRGGTAAAPSTTKSSSLYGGIYANKFGLSNKGLLQIDYTCSWNDLDRIIARTY